MYWHLPCGQQSRGWGGGGAVGDRLQAIAQPGLHPSYRRLGALPSSLLLHTLPPCLSPRLPAWLSEFVELLEHDKRKPKHLGFFISKARAALHAVLHCMLCLHCMLQLVARLLLASSACGWLAGGRAG